MAALQNETIKTPDTLVIGAGVSGLTLSWGCADDGVALAHN